MSQYDMTARESFDFWKQQQELTYLHIMALLGCEEGETGFRHGAVGDKGKAFGPAQWHWEPRGEAILAGCGIDVRTASHEDCLKAWLWEFKNREKKAWAGLLKSKTLEEGVIALVTLFERTKNPRSDIIKRTGYARKWANVFAGEKR